MSLCCHFSFITVAFQVYDIDQDGYISNGELFQVLKAMVEDSLTDLQLQQLVDKTIIYFDKDNDGKLSFEEFSEVNNLLICIYFLCIYSRQFLKFYAIEPFSAVQYICVYRGQNIYLYVCMPILCLYLFICTGMCIWVCISVVDSYQYI